MLSTKCTRRTAIAGIAACLVAPGFEARAKSTLERARANGVLRVGFANEAPWGFMKADGTLTGKSPEILKALAPKLGVKEIEGVFVEFGSLIPGLQANRFDVVATALTSGRIAARRSPSPTRPWPSGWV